MSQEFSDLDDLDPPQIDILTRIRSHVVPLIFALFGLLCIGIGIYFFSGDIFGDANDGIEVLETDTQSLGRLITVEVAGSVKSPGVYEMEIDDRVMDALEKAGGLTENADEEWIKKVLNRAAFLSDGQKIIIPSVNQQSGELSATENGGDQSASSVNGVSSVNLVNINTATLPELDALWGIGQVTGQKIIEQRPYSTVEELLSRKILKANVYEANKNLLTVY